MKQHRIIITYLASLFLSSCVYKIDIDQGNIIDQDMINQLRPGMSKRQVRYIMGTPLVMDSFHKNRWDYIYSKQPGGEERTQKRVLILFEGDELTGIQGEIKPEKTSATPQAKETTVIVPKRDIEKTFFGKIRSLFGFGDD